MRKTLWARLPVALVAILTFADPAASQTPTATYEVVFTATWSAETHPQDFPSFPHFSPPIGGTHDVSVHFWREGEPASLGIKRMAEWGSVTPLDTEVMAAISAGSAGEVIQALWIPESPGTTSTEFTVSTGHPLVTLVAMIAPTPDWFVGVEGLNLLQGQAWADSVVVDLFPFDAGTDSGSGYTSPDLATVPPDPVAAITGGPFSPGVSLGTFTFVCRDNVSPVPPPPTAELAVAPNPFNPRTTVSFRLDADRMVNLDIFDLRGRRVATLWEGVKAAGDHTVIWEGRDHTGRTQPSGTYLVNLRGDGLRETRPISLVR